MCVSGDVYVIAHYLFTKMTPGKNDKYFITTLTDCRYRTSLPATIGKNNSHRRNNLIYDTYQTKHHHDLASFISHK